MGVKVLMLFSRVARRASSPTTLALAVAISVGYLLAFQEETDDNGKVADEEIEMITEQDVTQIFDQLLASSRARVADTTRQIKRLEMMGQNVIPRQIQGLFRSVLSTTLKQTQEQLLQAAEIDNDCFEEATWEFLRDGNANVQQVVMELQQLWSDNTGDAVVGWRPHSWLGPLLSPAATIDAARVYFGALAGLRTAIANEFASSNRDLLQVSVQEEFRSEYAKRSSSTTMAVLEGINTNLSQFEASIDAYESDRHFVQTLTNLLEPSTFI